MVGIFQGCSRAMTRPAGGLLTGRTGPPDRIGSEGLCNLTRRDGVSLGGPARPDLTQLDERDFDLTREQTVALLWSLHNHYCGHTLAHSEWELPNFEQRT